ncbi:hypothetical protein FGIG_08953 [Fasciola gigantica]|uniref:mannosyl-oligosaccharide 1,3-1,6-alpha-mannosidase n=1 Tax=Fasciola gigantica TaxID=46835 RepID=A0A504YKB5_FASGI|nr:hypothetical protein FGIG_08953 [Fasciola gigantica]
MFQLRFATLSEYFEAFYRRHGYKPRAATQSSVIPMLLNLTLFTGDLFTYADRDHDYWSGFFTSRPVEKFLTRTLESELRSSELLYTYARHLIQRLPDSPLNETVHLLDDRITLARRALGLFQHHDGVTGTAKSHVVADYNRRLRSALNDCRLISAVSSTALLLALPSPAAGPTKRSMNPQQVINTIREVHRLPKESQGVATVISMEDLYFREAAPVPYRIKIETPHEPIPIVIFNPLLQPRITTVTVELNGVYEHFKVKFAPHVCESMGNPMTIQIESPDSDAGQQTRLRIGPVHLAPLSLSQLVIEHSETHSERSVIVSYEPPVRTQSSNLIWLNSDSIGLGFDAHTGLLRYLIDSRLNVVLNVTIDFLIYQTNEKAESRSGAYLFIPNSPGRVMELPNKPKVRITRGPLVQEIILYTPLVQHSVRLYKYPSSVIEIENTVSLGKFHPQNVELVMRIQSNVSNSDRTFFTDSNCFQFVRRQYYDKIPFQGNLYPMSCGVYIQSDSLADRPWVTRLHLFSTYSHGVTSPIPGALYVWLDRRTTDDDNRGLFEPLRGAWIARSNFRLFVEAVLPAQKKATPLLSTEAHAVVNDLIRPIQRFLVGHNISSFMARTVHLMPNFTMPKDYDLVSLKTFHHNAELFKTFSDYYGAQIGMLLRRLPVGFGEQTPHEIPVAQMFSRLNRTRAVRTPLTLIPEMSSVQSLQGRLPTVTVKPMELEAYLLTV